ncbi:conserved protein, unknown function [Hepatocystis sp. ex Piliocolobus tephrosceles]|nr:conserved protein, unknown function [Hepatocystis sp. ex Piliocolobus tephrosceles]
MKFINFFTYVTLFLFMFLNTKCLKHTPHKFFVNFKFDNYKYAYSNKQYYKSINLGFIGLNKKEYKLLNLNKKKKKGTNINKYIIKKYINSSMLYVQHYENKKKEIKCSFLNNNEKSLCNNLTYKVGIIFNKSFLTKFLCTSIFCLAVYSLSFYPLSINKKIEFVINVLKKKIKCLGVFKKSKHIFLTIPFSDFRSSPYFFSSILIASYSLYIILKVYIEKYREAKRIKSAIIAYNKNRDKYIETGDDSTDEYDDLDTDYTDDMYGNDHFNKDFY